MLLSKNRIIRRRAVVGLLLAASLTLLTLSFRQGSTGVVGEIQRDAVSITAPFATVAHRVTRPAVDAWNWGSGLTSARDSTEQLKRISKEAIAIGRTRAAEIISRARSAADQATASNSADGGIFHRLRQAIPFRRKPRALNSPKK